MVGTRVSVEVGGIGMGVDVTLVNSLIRIPNHPYEWTSGPIRM